MGQGPKARAWCFTINNYTTDDVRRLESLQTERCVVGAEDAPTTGTPHLQGYVRFKEPQRFSWWKNQFPTAHVEVRQGTETQAADYCKKDHRVLIDSGVNFDEKLAGRKRSRDEEACEIIEEMASGATYGQIRQRHRLFFFWNKRTIKDEFRDEEFLSRHPDLVPPF